MYSIVTSVNLSGHQLLTFRYLVWHVLFLTQNLSLHFSIPVVLFGPGVSFHDHAPTCWFLSASILHLSSSFWYLPPTYPRHVLSLCLWFCRSSFCPSPLFFLPHAQLFTAQLHSPQLASFPSCSHCAQMDRGMNLVSCSTRTPRE